MKNTNEHGQKVINRLYEMCISGEISQATQVQIIELLAAHLYLMTTTTFSRRSGKSYRAIRNQKPDLIIDGQYFYIGT